MTTLADWLKRSHSLDEQLEIVEGLCGALEDAHKRNVLHRALEPSRIEVGTDGSLRILPSASPAASPTSSKYLAPEVRDGGAYTPKSDLFTAGVIFYEMFAGRHPFVVETALGSEEAVFTVQPPPLRDVLPELPRDLADAITACLERDPEWRPSDTSYLQQVTQTLRKTTPKTSKKAAKSSKKEASTARETGILSSSTRPTPQRSWVPFAALAAIPLAAAAAWFLWMRPQAPETSPTPRPTPPPSTAAPATTLPEPSPSPTPEPKTSKSPSPRPGPSETPTPLSPSPSPRSTPPTPAPSAQPARPTPAPSEAPAPSPVPSPSNPVTAASEAPAGPALLTTVSPRSVRRAQRMALDVHGTGLRAAQQARFLKGRELAQGITVVRQRYVNGTLFQLIVQVDEGAAPGNYSLVLTDADGSATNGLVFEIAK